MMKKNTCTNYDSHESIGYRRALALGRHAGTGVLIALMLCVALVFGGVPGVFGGAQMAQAEPGTGIESSAGSTGGGAEGSQAGDPGADSQAGGSDGTERQTIRIGYYYGDPAFQDGFSDDERKSGYAYEYYQRLAPYAGWDYEYSYLTRTEALEALAAGEVDIVAGVYKTPRLADELLFSAEDMGLDGEGRYFAVNKDRPDLLAQLNAAQENLLKNNPKFELQNWQTFYGDTSVLTTLSDSERAWLADKESLRLGYLVNNLPISGHDQDGQPTGVLGAVIPIMEEYLQIPVEPVAYNNRLEMRKAIENGEVDVIFPVYADSWTSEEEGLYQTSPLVEDRIMIAYTGDYDEQVLKRVAASEAAIGQQSFLAQYDPSAELITYPTRAAAFDAVQNGEANSVIGNASILQLFIAEHPEYDSFNTAYLERSEGFSFAVRRDDPTLAVIMQEVVQQTDDSIITNAMIRYSAAQIPFSMVDVIQRYALPLLVVGMLIIAVIVIIFIRYRRRVNEFNEEQERARVALERALNAADDASAAKTSFLSNMSHDIRTPLNAIIGMTAIAGANLDDAGRVRDCLTKIASSSRHLLALINEILDVSKIESGRIELSEEPFDLSVMLKDLVDINKPQADAKNQKMIIRVKDIVHEEVIGDHVRLQQIYTNLVSNAIKYTHPGGTIDITLAEKDAGSPTIAQYEFIVKDNGIGISDEYLPHLFEAFTRADDKDASDQQGTGLGMPIALSTARMMNGDIAVESELGKGSTFTATVFLKIAEMDASIYEEFADLNVLVVDDDEAVCESTCIMLDNLGMNCDYVLSGQAAVDKLVTAEKTNEHYFAAIIDWVMPHMDGVETIREIRKRTTEEVPIIVISAYDWSEIEVEARSAGADFFVSKPLFKSRLTHLFAQILGTGEAKETDDLNVLTEEIDLSGKRALLAEDNELNAEVACAFLGMTGLEIDRVVNGQEAVEAIEGHEAGYYDCVFMDMQMPIMDGLAATRAIRGLAREDTDYDALPIFAMTANAFVDDVRKTKDAGMNGHFAKPLDFNVVIQTVYKQLRGK